jgi:hypothetical protein
LQMIFKLFICKDFPTSHVPCAFYESEKGKHTCGLQ